MTRSGENLINTIDVLAFKIEDDGTETFLYRSEATRSSGANYTVGVRRNNYADQRLVLIANARSQIAELFNGRADRWVGHEKELMLRNLTVELTNHWDVAAPHPMWSEVTINSSTTSITARMMRMTAKINVQLGSGLGAFQLRSVHVYNRNTLGRIAPNSNNIADEKAHKATPPTGATPTRQRLDYVVPPATPHAFWDAIYIFETAANRTNDFLDETCIVVGIETAVWGANYPPITYYRIDFINATTGAYLDILRNHLYAVNITQINGPGVTDPNDPFNPDNPDFGFRVKQYNLVTDDVRPWDMGAGSGDRDIGEVYYLNINQSVFQFDAAERNASSIDNLLTVETNFSNLSWAVSATQLSETTLSPDWLRVEPQGRFNMMTSLRLRVDANPNLTARTAWVHVKTGSWAKTVRVVQAGRN